MPQPTVSVHEIRWNEICPWLVLVRALRVSVMARVLLLAWAGVLLTQWGWNGIDQFMGSEGQSLSQLTQPAADSTGFSFLSIEASSQPDGPTLFDPTAQEFPGETDFPATANGSTFAGPLYRAWHWFTQPLLRMFSSNPDWWECLVLGLSGLWALVVWGLVGGAITRIAAMYLTRGETLGPLKAVQVALPKWATQTIAPLIPLAFALLLSAPMFAAGLLMRFDLFALLIGLGWGIALISGAVLAFVLVGLMVGWPLLWATIGVERTDALDGASRCYSYVYQRPLQLVFYVLVATLLGWLGQTFVQVLAEVTMQTTQWAANCGAGSERMGQLLTTSSAESTAMVAWAGGAIGFWNTSLASLVASYPMALLWSMSVGIYLLMRRHIDATEMEEVALDESEPAESLPPLEPHESGVPEVDKNTSGSP